MILALRGLKGSGKDEVATIINFLYRKHKLDYTKSYDSFKNKNFDLSFYTHFTVVKFASKLKKFVANLLDVEVEMLEDRVFKETPIPGLKRFWLSGRRSELKVSKYFASYEDADKAKQEMTIIKNALKILSEDLTPRILLAEIGTNCMRDMIHPDIWVISTMKEYKNCDGPLGGCEECLKHTYDDIPICNCKPNWIISDMRFPNEHNAVKEKNGITILINRKSVTESLKDTKLHESETALDDVEPDYTINNDGTIEDLIVSVEKILKTLKII